MKFYEVSAKEGTSVEAAFEEGVRLALLRMRVKYPLSPRKLSLKDMQEPEKPKGCC